MKLQKRFAVTCLEFILDYLEHDYYPVDDDINESAMVSKIFGFGLYHSLVETSVANDWVKRRELPKPKKTARLDLTEIEACVILDMMAEAFPRDIEETDAYMKLRKYLTKEFVNNADDTENSE